MHAQCWEPGTQYNIGDVVDYQGHKYKVIQAHFSQSDWAPGINTAALWGRLSDDDNNYGGGCNQPEGYNQQQQGYQQQQQNQYDQKSQYQQQNNEPPKSEENKHWYENEETKKKLEIGAGLAGGAALLAGGLFAYNKHEQHKDQAQTQGWAQGNWLAEAKQRKSDFDRAGSQLSALWILTHGQIIPRNAILVGPEHSWNLYICRAYHDGGIQLGKASQAFKNGGVLGYDNKEIFVNEYEVLVGDMNRLHWVSVTGVCKAANLGQRPVEGGRDKDGTPLYVAQAPYKDAVHPGKAGEGWDGAYIAYDGKERHVKEYRVLCYNN